MKAETRAKLAAKMAEMMGWGVDDEYEGFWTRPDGTRGLFDPWTDANDAIAFADWAEGGRDTGDYRIAEWARLAASGPVVLVEVTTEVSITPDCPFAHALTLACCRAIPELREIMEAAE